MAECLPSTSQARLKRVDFVSGVLMFEDLREEGAKTRGSCSDGSPRSSEGSRRSSEGSPRSSEGSPEGAASTLLAPAHRDHDQEEGSRTLVLVSAGNGQVSPGDGQGTLAALTPQGERPVPDESEPGALSSVVRSEPRPIVMTTAAVISGGSSSPPFTKVERTFIHIAETTHLNVMTAKHRPPGLDEVLSAERVESGGEEKQKEEKGKEKERDSDLIPMERDDENREKEKEGEEEKVEESQTEENDGKADELEKQKACYNRAEEAKTLFITGSHDQQETTEETNLNVKPESVTPVEEQKMKEEREECPSPPPEQKNDADADVEEEVDSPNRKPESTQRRSRIPVLMSEDETASDKSSQKSQEQLQRIRKSHQQHLARLVLERKQTHLRSRSASSRSPTPSTTASEDETNQSDDSGRRETGAEERNRSRIPRPVTPTKGPSEQLGSMTLPQTQRSVSFIQYR